ncbi:MAG: hypothetical protein CVU56_02165 [Deltaproteobacteria bacterium HGW-Deltaproteobacteria-14]|jgi:ABC-type uncharacterized transport system permease subunit|nr:MAG: hypothetical protein CVU56_02165 [Deltaproteobacteria bacterium HGW-Deltaproteobacteria-14]
MFLPLLIAASIGFIVATFVYVTRIVRNDVAVPRAGNVIMALATAALGGAAVAGLVGEGAGHIPTGPEIVLLVTFVFAILGLVGQSVAKVAIAGPVTAAIVGVVTFAILLKLEVAAPLPVPSGMRAVTIVHISATILGFLLFTPNFVLSVLFAGQVYRLKTKQLSNLRLPSLITLENHAWRLLFVGFPLYTVGILLGAIWQDSVASGVQPRQVFAALSWCVYAFTIYRRLVSGWRGTRAAVTLIFAYTLSLGAVLLYSLR